MPHRTYLTVPAGTEPTEATGRDADEPRERYVPGLAPASEPTVPSRARRPLTVLAILAVLLLLVTAAVRASLSAQAQDPSLDIPIPGETGGGVDVPTLPDLGDDADDAGLPGEG